MPGGVRGSGSWGALRASDRQEGAHSQMVPLVPCRCTRPEAGVRCCWWTQPEHTRLRVRCNNMEQQPLLTCGSPHSF